jgi:outer membrane protein TolC
MCTVLIALLLLSQTETSTLPPPKQFEIVLDDPLASQASRAPREVATWDEARELLRRRSTELRTAEHGVQRAEGMWRQALSALLPNLGASLQVAYDILNPDVPPLGGSGGTASTTDRKPTTPLGTGAISLDQTIVDLAAWRGLAGASANERSAEATLFDVRRRVTQGLAQSLIAVVAAERAAEINRVGLRQALESAALTERTFELGAATQLDVVRVRQDVAVARSAVISGDEQLRRTREALGLVLGIEGEVGVRRDFALAGLLEETRKHCRPLAEDEVRSDLVAAREDVAAAEASESQALFGYVPRLGVTSNVFALTTEPGPGRVASWSIAAVISFPLWEGGFREGLVEERAGFAGQAAEAAEALRRSIQLELARARRAEEVAKMLMDSATEARDLAARTDAMTRRSFEIGRATSVELVLSAAVLRQAELNLALREFEWVQARLDEFLTEAQCEG